MKDRGRKNGSPPSSFERFEYLAQRLFAVEKREVEKERTDYEASREKERKPRLRFPASLRRFAMKLTGKEPLRCSFCGKTSDEVTYLLAGGSGTVYICGGCVDICVGIIKQTRESGSAQNPPQ